MVFKFDALLFRKSNVKFLIASTKTITKFKYPFCNCNPLRRAKLRPSESRVWLWKLFWKPPTSPEIVQKQPMHVRVILGGFFLHPMIGGHWRQSENESRNIKFYNFWTVFGITICFQRSQQNLQICLTYMTFYIFCLWLGSKAFGSLHIGSFHISSQAACTYL